MNVKMIGQYARSIAGHDSGQLYVIISSETGKVSVADGKSKKLANPKVKNAKHIQIIDKKVDDNIIEAIIRNNSNVNDLIRNAIRREERNV